MLPFIGGGGHTVHELPQVASAVFVTQSWPQACWLAGQVHWPALHDAPLGHSVLRRQPARQRRVVGSQYIPAPHDSCAQSVGSKAQVP